MGNIHKYKVKNSSSMSSKKSHSFFSGLGCNVLRIKKKKLDDPFKSKSLNFEDNDDVKFLQTFTIPRHDSLVHSDKKLNNMENVKKDDENDKTVQLRTADKGNTSNNDNKAIIGNNVNSGKNPPKNDLSIKNCQKSISFDNFDKSKSNCFPNVENNPKENGVAFNCDYSESYKSYLCRKNRYISSPRTCFDNFKFSNYSLKRWENGVVEKDAKTVQSSPSPSLLSPSQSPPISDSSPFSTNPVRCEVALPSSTLSNDRLKSKYPRLSENSLNSDDLMLGTENDNDDDGDNDDDVSKDYRTTEKSEPCNVACAKLKTKSETVSKKSAENNTKSSNFLESSVEQNGDESEKNDTFTFENSQDTSANAHRKNMASKGFSLRPHSFSSPLRPALRDSKFQSKRNSNLSTIDAFDVTWTWISASEAANLSQEVSNLKLMLLKMRRLLLDETNSDMARNDASINAVTSSNVFSEPSTPVCHNSSLTNILPNIDNQFVNKNWESMTKEMLIQELRDLKRQNGTLEFQLKEKCRIISLLQGQQQHYRNYSRRLHSVSSKSEKGSHKLIRSSTFETASALNNQAFCCQDVDLSLT